MSNRIKAIKKKLFADITSVPEILQPSHLPGLDGLRGIAIIMVILSHFFMHTAYTRWFIGIIGVWIFFVISGFLITTLLLKEKFNTGKISLKKFYLRRIFRILPVAYLFILVVIILNNFLHLGIRPISFISSGLFVQNIPIPGINKWYVEHFWSLSVEEQFYLVFPILLVYDLSKYLKIIIFLIIFIPVIEFFGFNNIGPFYTNHTLHIITFVIINLFDNSIFILVGSLMSILLFKGFLIIKDTFFTRLLSILLFIVVLLVRTETSKFFIPDSDLYLLPFLIGLIVILNLNPKSFFNYLLENKILTYIGVLSYSLYIWQQLFDNSQNWIVQSNSVLLHLALLFIIANASYYLYERFFLRIKNRYKVKLQ
jgi:peptidoglycan/LPS O-acetylase OafA/YrhL